MASWRLAFRCYNPAMRGALHVLGTIVLLPYLLLAIAFALIGQAAASKSLGALLWTLLTQLTWIVPWGILGFVAGVILVAALGFSVRLRGLGYLCLSVLALASLLVIVILPGGGVGFDGLVFLAPCIAVLVFSAWYGAAEWRV